MTALLQCYLSFLWSEGWTEPQVSSWRDKFKGGMAPPSPHPNDTHRTSPSMRQQEWGPGERTYLDKKGPLLEQSAAGGEGDVGAPLGQKATLI